MKKVIIGGFIVVLVIVAGVVVASNIGKDNEVEKTSTDPENQAVANITNTNKENNVVENNVVENNVAENNVVEENNTEDNTTEESGPVDETKAIEIVKKEWGNTSGYEFAIDYKNNNGEYIVSVRDTSTTRVVEWYTVNAETGECSVM